MPDSTFIAVSVVIPTYNRAELVQRAVCSVLAATAPGDEIIVVDDGSTDDTPRALDVFGERIRRLAGPHRGVSAARNMGIAAATRPLLAFLDSDDEWLADKLALQRAFMQARPDVVLCFGDFRVRRSDGRPDTPRALTCWHPDRYVWDELLGPGVAYSRFAPLPTGRPDFRVHVGDLYPALLNISYVTSPAAVVRRALAGAALRFPEDLHVHEDQECFIRIARTGPAAYFDCELFWNWGHAGPRLSRVHDAYRAACRLKMLERTYGVDPGYLGRHTAEYGRAVQHAHLNLARCLLRDGRMAQARDELRQAGGGPLRYRALAALPGPVMRGAVELRRRLHAAAGA